MIQAEELRIGNLINVAKGSSIKRQGTWRYVNHRVISDIASGNNKDYEPIQITEEWLLKFGFIRNGNYYNWSIKYFFLREEKTLSIEGEFGFTASITYRDKFAMISTLKYVHQLQNLYFSLSGQKLEITSLPVPE